MFFQKTVFLSQIWSKKTYAEGLKLRIEVNFGEVLIIV